MKETYCDDNKGLTTMTNEPSCCWRVQMMRIIKMAYYEGRRLGMEFFFGECRARNIVRFNFLL
jgi:hypothetical protein